MNDNDTVKEGMVQIENTPEVANEVVV